MQWRGAGQERRRDRSRWIQEFPAGFVPIFVCLHGNFGADPQFSSLWEGARLLLQGFQWETTALVALVLPYYEEMEFPAKTLWEHHHRFLKKRVLRLGSLLKEQEKRESLEREAARCAPNICISPFRCPKTIPETTTQETVKKPWM